MLTKDKPHTARRWRCIIIRNLWKMRADVIPWIDQRGAFIVGVALCFFLDREF